MILTKDTAEHGVALSTIEKIPIDCAEWNGSRPTLQLNCLSGGKSMARFELVRGNCWSLVKISSDDFVGMMVMITFDV